MSFIDGLLPLIDKESWRWNTQSETNTVVGAGDREKLLSAETDIGWFYWGFVTVSGNAAPNTEINIQTGRFNVSSTIGELYQNGVTSRGTGSPTLTRYDTNEDIYSVLYEPMPAISFADEFEITLEGDQDEQVTITSDMLELQVLDQQSFRESLTDIVFARSQKREQLEVISDQLAATNNLLAAQIDAMSENGLEDFTQGEATPEREPIQTVRDRVDQETKDGGRDGDLRTLGK